MAGIAKYKCKIVGIAKCEIRCGQKPKCDFREIPKYECDFHDIPKYECDFKQIEKYAIARGWTPFGAGGGGGGVAVVVVRGGGVKDERSIRQSVGIPSARILGSGSSAALYNRLLLGAKFGRG